MFSDLHIRMYERVKYVYQDSGSIVSKNFPLLQLYLTGVLFSLYIMGAYGTLTGDLQLLKRYFPEPSIGLQKLAHARVRGVRMM